MSNKTFHDIAAELGHPGCGGFLELVAMRAKTLAQHHPDKPFDQVLEEAMRQTVERERYLMTSQNTDARIFRRVLCTEVYSKARAIGQMSDTLDLIEAELAADNLREAYRTMNLD